MAGKKPHVLIVGAGLGGLTLAQALRKQGIPTDVYERDVDINSRFQGWAISVHTIIDELASCVPSDLPPLEDSVNHLAPLKLNAQICLYFRGSRWAVQNDPPETHVMRANRQRFRGWLSTGIDVHWGKKLKTVENAQGEVKLAFEDGSTASGDVVIGADGVHSIVREILLKRPNRDLLRTLPIATIVGELTLSGPVMERQLSLGHSAYSCSARDLSFYTFVGLNDVNPDQQSGKFYWLLAWEDADVDRPDHWLRKASQQEKYDYALGRTGSEAGLLDPKFSEVFRLTTPEGIRKEVFVFEDMELEVDDVPRGRVAILGDAAHPMAPFRGEGGMHALQDAFSLGRLLGEVDTTDSSSIERAIAAYNGEMIPRGMEAARKSRNGVRTLQSSSDKIFTWGHEAKSIPEEHVSLEAVRS